MKLSTLIFSELRFPNMAPTDWSQLSPPDNATAQDSPDVQNEAVRQRQQAQANAALDLEQSRAQMAATREQQAQAQTNRQLAGQGAASDAAQWANTSDYANQPWATAPAEAKQHFVDAWSSIPGGGTGVAEELPGIWNEAQRNATGNSGIGLEGLTEGQTANVKVGGVPVTVGKPPKLTLDPSTGKYFQMDPQTGQPRYVQIQDSPGAQGPPGEAPLTGDDFLQSLDPGYAGALKAVAEGRQPISSFGTRQQQARAAKDLQQYDPTASATTLPVRQALQKSFTSGPDAANITSLNTAIGHLGRLSDAATALNNRSFTTWNTVANAAESKLGDKAVTNFDQAKTAVASELAKLFKGTGSPTTVEIHEWEKPIDSSNSPEQLQASIQGAIELMKSRADALRQKYENGFAKPNEKAWLGPQQRAILRKLGVDPGSLDPASATPGTVPAAPVAPAANPAGILGTPSNVTTPPVFKTPEEVRDAFKSGALPRDQAKAILQSQFGHQ